MAMINFLRTHPTLNQVSLRQSEIWQMTGDLRGETIVCLEGKLWVTQTGDPNDHILNAGDSFWVTRAGMVVVQAFENGRFRCERVSLPKTHRSQATSLHA
jgi:hypothetical protein